MIAFRWEDENGEVYEKNIFLDSVNQYLSIKTSEEIKDKLLWDLLENIFLDNNLQKLLVDFINNHTFTKQQKWEIFYLIREIYSYPDYEDEKNLDDLKEKINFDGIYEWVLDLMFTKEFFDYSWSYKFAEVLMNISCDVKRTYSDIIGKIDLNNLITVRIAICSTYAYGFNFYKYKDITKQFLDIILTSLEKNIDNENIIRDFQCFMVSCLDRLPYIRYKRLFRRYLR